MKALSAVLLALVLLVSPAFGQSQAAMNQEASEKFEAADKQLNVLYGKVMKTLDAEGAEKLKAAQKAWVAFRDAEASFQADKNRGGTLSRYVYNETLGDLTEARIAQLQKYLDDSQE